LPAASSLPPPPVVALAAGDKRTRWTALRERVLGDAVCRAHVRPGKQVVFGVGDIAAKIFFCGEAPGAEEEQQGEPFVGPAGQLLNKMIQGMGLRREDVYIGNIMNWRPEMPTAFGNRPPNAEEMAYCLPFLRAQIEVVDPALIVALGATAARGLLGAENFKSLGEIRGHWKQFAGKPVMVTYHPSYLLHNDTRRAKRAVWEDLLQVMERTGLPISEKQRGYYL
jgi:DNA polymerase